MLLFQTTHFFRKPFLFLFTVVLALSTTACEEPSPPTDTTEEIKSPVTTRFTTTMSSEQANAINENLEQTTALKKAPSFPGGPDAFAMYLKSNLKYPEQEKADGIKESILVNFNVQADGSITEVVNINGTNQNLIDAAIVAVENMPNWEPGIDENGQAVTSSFVVPIVWTLKTDSE